MKRFLPLCLLLFVAGSSVIRAQQDASSQKRDFNDAFMHADSLSGAQKRDFDDAFMRADSLGTLSAGDSLSVSLPWHAPLMPAAYGFDPLNDFPGGLYGSSWRLHEGFNGQFSLSMTAGLGRRAPRGVGFGQTAAFAYLLPVNQRLAVAAGIYAANLDWGTWHQTDAGLSALVAYRATDRINLYGYATASFMPRADVFRHFRYDPFPLFLEREKYRVGAAAEFKVGENAVIGVSVEHRSY